jgi:parvulin-like peptidyl-prolyl isomerase
MQWRAAILSALLPVSIAAWAQGIYPGTAVRVNGAAISYQRFNGVYEEYLRDNRVNITTTRSPERLTRMRREAMDLLVEQELIRQAAEAQGIEVAEAEVDAAEAQFRAAFKSPGERTSRLESEGYTEDSYRDHLRRMIAASKYLDGIRARVATVSDAELETYYHNNAYRLTLPEQVRVRHILLTWKPLGTLDDRAAVRAQMTPILEETRRGGDFAELARAHSEDATAQDGGDTGFFYRGRMVPAFEDAAFALQPGEISDLVETPFGVHILKLEERQEARLLPLEEIREQLRDHVRNERAEAAVEAEIVRLRDAAEIEILIPL